MAEGRTTEQPSDSRVLVRTPDGDAAIPMSILEQHRVPDERRAEVLAGLDDTSGFSADALPADAPLYTLDQETLSQYRIAEGDDVSGYMSFSQDYMWGQFLGVGPLIGAIIRSNLGTLGPGLR